MWTAKLQRGSIREMDILHDENLPFTHEEDIFCNWQHVLKYSGN